MTSRYDTDFYGWTQEQAKLLRAGNVAQMDIAHVLEEIEAMGRSEKRALSAHLEVLLVHLLKWRYQPERQSRSWQFTIEEQRHRIAKILAENPSLRYMLSDTVADAYQNALIGAEYETYIKRSAFPATCPWTWEQIMDAAFFPESEHLLKTS